MFDPKRRGSKSTSCLEGLADAEKLDEIIHLSSLSSNNTEIAHKKVPFIIGDPGALDIEEKDEGDNVTTKIDEDDLSRVSTAKSSLRALFNRKKKKSPPKKPYLTYELDSCQEAAMSLVEDISTTQLSSKLDLDEGWSKYYYWRRDNRSRKPGDYSYMQQRLPAWKPMLTPKFVVNLFLLSSLTFIPIGIFLKYTSDNIYEVQFDYTDCNDTQVPHETCHSQVLRNISYRCHCRINFVERQFQDQTLHIYYMLENYHQNQRLYVRSRDYDQLLGKRENDPYLSSECEPYRYFVLPNNRKLKYEPCGAIANSMFNDTFKIYYIQNSTNLPIKLNISKKELAWESDRKYKYKTPTHFENTIKPLNWAINISQLDSGYRNEDFMVWMRTAAFPTFRKLYGRILLEENANLKFILNTSGSNSSSSTKSARRSMTTVTNNNNNSTDYRQSASSRVIYRLPKGQYFVEIEYNYLVKQFHGRKYFILANIGWTGGRVYFMAYAYIVAGALCLITALVLFGLHYNYGSMDYNSVLLISDSIAHDPTDW